MRHTGGRVLGTISTKSNSAWKAFARASSMETTPTCSPSASINRTLGLVICSFKRVVLRLSAAMVSFPPKCIRQFHHVVFG